MSLLKAPSLFLIALAAFSLQACSHQNETGNQAAYEEVYWKQEAIENNQKAQEWYAEAMRQKVLNAELREAKNRCENEFQGCLKK